MSFKENQKECRQHLQLKSGRSLTIDGILMDCASDWLTWMQADGRVVAVRESELEYIQIFGDNDK